MGETWFVYAKEPFAGPEQVLAYLSRYTHRVAISNGRLLKADRTTVTFSVNQLRTSIQFPNMAFVPIETRRVGLVKGEQITLVKIHAKRSSANSVSARRASFHWAMCGWLA